MRRAGLASGCQGGQSGAARSASATTETTRTYNRFVIQPMLLDTPLPWTEANRSVLDVPPEDGMARRMWQGEDDQADRAVDEEHEDPGELPICD